MTRGADKRALGLARQALAADMESFAMAERAGTKAAVCALRVVSDAVGDELPAEVGTFLDEKGSVRVGRVARYALRGPASIRTLRALKARRDRSLAGLTAAWRVVWPLLRR
ncbi:MAG: hypothetical protein NTW87_31470 [Planctomycetota bacterium]|nr:hypothetical protein [Planctomycetota bacterium]